MKKTLVMLSALFIFASCTLKEDSKVTTEYLQSHIEDGYLDLSHQELTQVPKLSKYLTQEERESILYVNLSNNQIKSLRGELQDLPNLKELNVSRNPLKTLDTISNKNLLRKIEAFATGLEKINIKNLSGLTYLDVSYNNLESDDLKDIEAFTGLTELQIHRNKLTNIEGIEKLQELQQLKIEFNNISDVSLLESLPNLVFVSTAFNPLPDEVIKKWNEFSQNNRNSEEEIEELL